MAYQAVKENGVDLGCFYENIGSETVMYPFRDFVYPMGDFFSCAVFSSKGECWGKKT